MKQPGSGLNVFGGKVDLGPSHHQASARQNLDLPTSSQYTHISLSARSFHSFILLLGRRNLVSEIPLALAWMRGIGIKPLQKTLMAALTHVSESEGPARLITVEEGEGNSTRHWLRDEEVLRMWLEHWLGRKAVPSEDEVCAYGRSRLAAVAS
jgi:hypothetical protein